MVRSNMAKRLAFSCLWPSLSSIHLPCCGQGQLSITNPEDVSRLAGLPWYFDGVSLLLVFELWSRNPVRRLCNPLRNTRIARLFSPCPNKPTPRLLVSSVERRRFALQKQKFILFDFEWMLFEDLWRSRAVRLCGSCEVQGCPNFVLLMILFFGRLAFNAVSENQDYKYSLYSVW